MSWMSYIDSLMGSKTMSHVGIFGSDGSTWASSPNYPVIFLFFYMVFQCQLANIKHLSLTILTT